MILLSRRHHSGPEHPNSNTNVHNYIRTATAIREEGRLKGKVTGRAVPYNWNCAFHTTLVSAIHRKFQKLSAPVGKWIRVHVAINHATDIKHCVYARGQVSGHVGLVSCASPYFSASLYCVPKTGTSGVQDQCWPTNCNNCRKIAVI